MSVNILSQFESVIESGSVEEFLLRQIDPERLPVSDSLKAYCDAAGRNPVDLVLQGGEDYELAFTSCDTDFASDWTFECRLTHIGKVVSGTGHVRIGSDSASERYNKRGFDHFSGDRGRTL